MATAIFLKALLLSLFRQSYALPLLSRVEIIPRKSYTSSRKKSGRKVSVGVLAAIVIISVFLVLVVAAIYFIWRRIQRRRRQNPDTLKPVRAEGNELQQQYYMPPPPPAQLGMGDRSEKRNGTNMKTCGLGYKYRGL